VLTMVEQAGMAACSASLTRDCVNATASSGPLAAEACAEMLGYEALSVLMYSYSTLPPGQFRVTEQGLEANVYTDSSAGNTTRRALQFDKCSSFVTHTCRRDSTGYVFESRFDAETGSGVKYSRDWQASPSAAVFLSVNEILTWTATCSRSSLRVPKKHYFKAGVNTITRTETTRGRSTNTVYFRCVTLTMYVEVSP